MSARDKLIKDAQAAGFTMETSAGQTLITRRNKSGRITCGIVLWPDGTANRIDIPLEQTTCIRTFKQMRKILGI